jgi:hypothetical protein
MSSSLPSSVRIYATAYRSITLPGDADFCWAAMSPLTSIASWGCSVVDRCEVDPTDEKVRLVYLVPANPSDVVLIREKCIKTERSPGGNKGTIVFESLVPDDSTSSFFASASPFPVRLVEMTTSLTISGITTLASPLGRSFVELRSSFVVESPEAAETMRNFLEVNLFDPLLHSAAEMLIPCHPFRDAMFHSVMKHFESSIEKLIEGAIRLKATERISSSSQSPAASKKTENLLPSVSASEFTSSSISLTQEVYSAWLETSRELRRIEKKYEESLDQLEEWKDNSLLRAPQQQHHMTARYERALTSHSSKHQQVLQATRKPFDALNDAISPHQEKQHAQQQQHAARTSSNLPMQDAIALNTNNVFGHQFFSGQRHHDENNNHNNNSVVSPQQNKSQQRYDRISAVVMMPRSEDWHQEVFDDGRDDLVDQDGGVGDHNDHRFISISNNNNNSGGNCPPPPPRRVLGNK